MPAGTRNATPTANIAVIELPAAMATGVTVDSHPDEEAWHQAAVKWWVSMPPDVSVVPVLSSDDGTAYPREQAAQRVSLHAGQDSLTVRAEAAGWAWLRVPWDPDWRSVDGTPVRKGGPGHLVVWAERGVTELRWSVPGAVDAAAAAVTGASLLATMALSAVNRRRGWETDSDRRRPAADALEMFADTVDGWVRAATRRARLSASALVAANNAVEGVVPCSVRLYRFESFRKPIHKGQRHRVCSHRPIPSPTNRSRGGIPGSAGPLPNLVADVRGIALQTVIIWSCCWPSPAASPRCCSPGAVRLFPKSKSRRSRGLLLTFRLRPCARPPGTPGQPAPVVSNS